MRRCFEQLPFRSQLCSHPIAPRLSFFRAGSSQISFVPKLPSYIPPLPATRKSLSYSFRNRRQDAPSPAPQDVSASTQARSTRKSKAIRKKDINTARPSQRSPEDWVAEVERFLPRRLSRPDDLESRAVIPPDVDVEDVLRTLTSARNQSDVDILGFLALNQRRFKAVVGLVEILLKAVALAANEPFKDELPSNIDWPHGSFAKRDGAPIELERPLHVSRRPLGSSRQPFDFALSEKSQEITMELIWSLLADLVLASTNRPSDEGKQIMNTVHQILALIHNLGLVPPTIYTYCLPQGTTTLQQSPILHLLNSRILSTLSDAVWHAYQDEVTARSGKTESSPWNIFREPPPSRLRPKRRELGPEVWLEFILWCCVEAGFAATGARIIQSLQTDAGGPWQAIHWPDNRVPSIDWDQRTRRGDLQSQGESYHGEQLAVDTPRKFVSAEVVLAIADCLINNLNVSVTDGEVPVTEIQDDIKGLISFAEPHGLAPAYFDYLAVRLLQTESMYDMDKANSLRKLASTISQLRAMHYVEGTHLQSSGLDFDSILDHSEVHAGILHQGLQACIEANLVTKAVDTFTEIQKMVDGNKLEAIGEFLSLSLSPEDGFFTSRHAKGRGEFLNTYGQLPIYKLPPFLDLVSNAGLFGLGDWLLFSEDIDGAILPPSTWAKRSVTAAVTRYASAKNDPILIKRIYSLTKRSGRKLTVNVIRALVVYHVNACDWTSAVLNLRDLRRAEGGGYSPKIVASLAAKILALEVDPAVMRQEDAESDLSQAMLLLCNILDGIYDSPAASFRIAQKRTFRQQVGYLLRLLENVADGELAETATRFKSRFPVSNEPNLATDTFNVLFSAIVETRGVLEGRNIWHLFCKDPRDYPSSVLLVGGHDSTSDDHATDKDEDEFFEGQTNDARNDVVGFGEPDKDYLGSRMITVDSPQISDAIQHAGSQIPVASPASLNINSALPLDDLDLAGNPSSSTSDVGSEDPDIPVEMVGMDMDSAPPLLNPIVVPNMRTLQIIVRGALSEIQDRKERKRGHTDLDAILRWAEQFYGAFNLAREDIETELRISESLPGKLRIATKHRRAAYGLRREKFRLDVGKLFTKGVFVPRRPGPQQPGQETTPSNGTDDMTEVAVITTQGEAEDGGEQIEPPSRPTFKVRKFATSVQHA
ncbi:uncharacterized protein PV07_11640 [Cladophialophora immunda]|uniref:Uncharacterized protein n=1 Tax=Cladophialophora immunda TaxID=569365 RepID=A0A0D1Z781_9EURO|nr:uncharacterized protein PV07_11640 [Cladophialophora immunda]KIW23446.1 hypothetical protein PV07_11640 [Cladophialophora immunda]